MHENLQHSFTECWWWRGKDKISKKKDKSLLFLSSPDKRVRGCRTRAVPLLISSRVLLSNATQPWCPWCLQLLPLQSLIPEQRVVLKWTALYQMTRVVLKWTALQRSSHIEPGLGWWIGLPGSGGQRCQKSQKRIPLSGGSLSRLP